MSARERALRSALWPHLRALAEVLEARPELSRALRSARLLGASMRVTRLDEAVHAHLCRLGDREGLVRLHSVPRPLYPHCDSSCEFRLVSARVAGR